MLVLPAICVSLHLPKTGRNAHQVITLLVIHGSVCLVLKANIARSDMVQLLQITKAIGHR